jgi:hypothetical protein
MGVVEVDYCPDLNYPVMYYPYQYLFQYHHLLNRVLQQATDLAYLCCKVVEGNTEVVAEVMEVVVEWVEMKDRMVKQLETLNQA